MPIPVATRGFSRAIVVTYASAIASIAVGVRGAAGVVPVVMARP